MPLAQVWTHSLFITVQNWKFLNFAMWTHYGLNWFFLPNPILAICLNFHQQNSPKNQYLSHFSSENCAINSIKYFLRRALQQHQSCPEVLIQFSISIFFNFYSKNDSIINSFHTIAPNSLKPSQCTHTHRELSKDTKSETWSTMKHCGLGDLSARKQNEIPCFIDK